VLESLAWAQESPLWGAIETAGGVPSCEDVTIPNNVESSHPTHNLLASPIVHPRVQRISGEQGIRRSKNCVMMIMIIDDDFSDDRYGDDLDGGDDFDDGNVIINMTMIPMMIVMIILVTIVMAMVMIVVGIVMMVM